MTNGLVCGDADRLANSRKRQLAKYQETPSTSKSDYQLCEWRACVNYFAAGRPEISTVV